MLFDDYSLLASVWIDLYEITFDIQWLHLAKKLTEYVWLHFGNKERDMFFIHRTQPKASLPVNTVYTDNVIPASNSVLAQYTLYRLGVLFEKSTYIQTSEKCYRKCLTKLLNMVHTMPIRHSYWENLFIFIRNCHHWQCSCSYANELQKSYLPVSVLPEESLKTCSYFRTRYIKDKTMIYVCVDKKLLTTCYRQRWCIGVNSVVKLLFPEKKGIWFFDQMSLRLSCWIPKTFNESVCWFTLFVGPVARVISFVATIILSIGLRAGRISIAIGTIGTFPSNYLSLFFPVVLGKCGIASELFLRTLLVEPKEVLRYKSTSPVVTRDT